jgi:hypothetical protein
VIGEWADFLTADLTLMKAFGKAGAGNVIEADGGRMWGFGFSKGIVSKGMG